jgi:quercetin dioxygenase-like cupin family protein
VTVTGISVVDHRQTHDGYAAPHSTAIGQCTSSLAEFDDGMWALRATLEPGTSVQWTTSHGDEGVYLIDGTVELSGDPSLETTRCETGAAVILESSAPLELRALTRTEIWHCGTSSIGPYVDGILGPPNAVGHGVHVVPQSAAQELIHPHADGSTATSTYYADGVCRTCRIALFKNGSSAPGEAPSHTHSESEVMHVTVGELRVGGVVAPAGTSVFIPAEFRYGFRTPGAWEFLNYRRGLANQVRRPHDEPRLETWSGLEGVTATW